MVKLFKKEIIENRKQLINKLISEFKFKDYLEIGCDKNQVFESIDINKVGIDPFSGGTLRILSDDFFRINKQKFDIIFIDGLHHNYQVKKDIYNSLNILNDKGIIIIHDCNPQKEMHQTRDIKCNSWNGDVWKAFLHFRSLPNIDSWCTDIDQGCGIIIKQYNTQIINIDNINLTWEYLINNRDKLRLKTTDKIIKILKDRLND